MQLNNNSNAEFEYSGSPKKEHFGMIFFSIFLGIISFGIAYYCNNQFVAYENGQEIHIFDKLFQIYQTFGKWPVLILFIGAGIGMFYAAYVHFKKYQETKNNNF